MKLVLRQVLCLLVFLQACGRAPAPVSALQSEDLTEGRYIFRSVNSGMCLESPGNSKVSGTILQQWPCNGADAQIFTLKKSGRGYQFGNHDTSKVMDVRAGSREPGVRLQLWDANGSTAQQFTLERSAKGDQFYIQAVVNGLVLDVDAISKKPAAQVLQWPKTGGANQLWTVERVREADGWKLVWSDEFNGDAIDRSKWDFEVKHPRWVNNELQNYTDNRRENARIENGQLVIEARKDNFNGHEYSSARLKTQGKASWTYGRVEARIKLPYGKGTWPAFWMMPDDQRRGWPDCGEIDIMEHVGYDQDWIHATTHSATYSWKSNTQRTARTYVKGVADGFHVYKIEWYPDRIDTFVDGVKYYTSPNDNSGDNAYPFNKNFHIILNLAVGGDWGGAQGVDGGIWPQQMRVDWVRVYQR